MHKQFFRATVTFWVSCTHNLDDYVNKLFCAFFITLHLEYKQEIDDKLPIMNKPNPVLLQQEFKCCLAEVCSAASEGGDV